MVILAIAAALLQGSPLAPTELQQLQVDTVTTILPGAMVPGSVVIYRAVVHATEAGVPVRLRVEATRIGESEPRASGSSEPALDGETAELSLSTAYPGLYAWRAWCELVSSGADSEGIEFNSEEDLPDFEIQGSNWTPFAPASLQQLRRDGSSIWLGGESTDSTVDFEGVVNCPSIGAHECTIELELRPLGTPFSHQPTQLSDAFISAPGATRLRLENLAGAYHWQLRTRCQTGAFSAWKPFGNNSEEEADFLASGSPPVEAPPPAKDRSSDSGGGCSSSAPRPGALSWLLALLAAGWRRPVA